jgi:hypothetical protein
VLIWRRHNKPWWKVHDHAWNVFVRTVANEKAAAERERRDFEINDSLALMVKQLHTDWDEIQIVDFVIQQVAGKSHENAEAVIKCFLAERPSATEDEKSEIRRIVEDAFHKPSVALRVRIVIAGLIEENLGPNWRAEYLYQAVQGRI